MAETIHISPETFALGNYAFRLQSRNQWALDGARKLYLSTSSSAQYQVFDLDAGIVCDEDADWQRGDHNTKRDLHRNLDRDLDDPMVQQLRNARANRLRALTTDAYRHHAGHLYLDGCALITDRSELVLLAGASHAGKTTLTVAAVAKLGWKVLSEDLILIEPSLDAIVPLVNPLSVRPGALNLIQEATGMEPPNLYLDRWLAHDDMFYAGPAREPKFARAIIIQSGNSPGMRDLESPTLRHESVSSHQFLRNLLPLSNAVHLGNGVDSLSKCIGESPCSVVYGGTVKERLILLKELMTPNPSCRDRHDSSGQLCRVEQSSVAEKESSCVSQAEAR